MSDGVTRMEIAEAVQTAFARGGADRDEILATATKGETRPEVLAVLSSLSKRRYARLNQLWEELDDIPVSF
ncbi:MAG TPA: hypothetical protein VMS99_07490 [Acidimicrobiia bacterium]|nr:hypothetical protein [Acidimicrobiia bacterium]